jgi:hypothetical protein
MSYTQGAMKIYDTNLDWRKLISDETLRRWPDDILVIPAEHLKDADWPVDRCIFVTDKMPNVTLLETMIKSGCRHIVQTSNPNMDHAINLSAHLIHHLEGFMEKPVENYFAWKSSTGTNFHQIKFLFRSSKEKRTTLDAIGSYLETISSATTVREQVLAIADELYLNAIFNGPQDKSKRPKFAKLQRNQAVDLEPNVFAELFVAHDSHTLIIGCEDPFGSLVPLQVIKRLRECYVQGASEVLNLESGGAGIGCYLMLEQSSSYFLLVNPGKKTVVMTSLPLGLSSKVTFMVPKNLHAIQTP